jgi:hypothetical protein
MSPVQLEFSFQLPNGDTAYVYRDYHGHRITIVIDNNGITRAVGL